jgi:GH25 family lysozyme M1 (1,4-beta-N-acetylmuramidase)
VATCRGIDVSAYQSAQDWGAHKRNGVVFAFAKASEGQRSRDARFAQHIAAIKAAGLIPGAYHFGWPNQDAKTEANNYIGAVKQHAGKGFVHWLDLERYSDGRNYAGRTAAQIKAWAATWINAVEAAFPGQRVGIYTSGDDIAKGHVPAGVPLWFPAYPGASVDTYAEAEARPAPSPSGRAPLIWQFTSDPAGSGPNLDLNIAYMSADALRKWAGGTAPTAPTGPGSTTEDDVAIAKLSEANPIDVELTSGAWTRLAFQDAVIHAGPRRLVGPTYVQLTVAPGTPAGTTITGRFYSTDTDGSDESGYGDIGPMLLPASGSVQMLHNVNVPAGKHLRFMVQAVSPDGTPVTLTHRFVVGDYIA